MVDARVAQDRAADILTKYRQRVEPARKHNLKAPADVPARRAEAQHYSVMSGGKRLRPALVLAACELCGGSAEQALPGGAAVECVHAFSLVHDDLPALDDDDLRRGRATVHKVYGEAMALLAGDALLTRAFEILTEYVEAADVSSRLCGELAAAVGWRGMIAGQVADGEGQNRLPDRELVDYIHRYKTGRLICCACRMGALSAGADARSLAAVSRFGEHLGLAFQITDDLLDATGSAEQVGKRTGKDAEAGKQTYPQIVGIDGSRSAAERETASAVAALEPMGSRAEPLARLARFVLSRVS